VLACSKEKLKQAGQKLCRVSHRDKPRVRTPPKNVSTFVINIFYYFCLWSPLLFLIQSKETVSWCFFYNKSKILSILFIAKYEKNHTFWSAFSVVGAHILHVQMRKRNRNKTLKHTHSRLISMVRRGIKSAL